MKTIELGHLLEPEISVYPGTPQPEFEQMATHEQNGYAELFIKMPTHTGTHLDAPFHIIPGGKTLTDLPIDRFFGKATVIPKPEKEFDLDWLKKYEKQIEQAEFVLLNTGASKFWKTNQYMNDYPVLTEEAAHWLTSKRIKGIGLDAISIDKPDATEFVLHKIVLGAGLIIIENLKNLDQLDGKVFDFWAIPLPIKDADGSPCRAFAITD